MNGVPIYGVPLKVVCMCAQIGGVNLVDRCKVHNSNSCWLLVLS